jgi:hypothetical protein
MHKLARIALGIVGISALAIAATAAIGSWKFERRISDEITALVDSAPGRKPHLVTEADLEGLPEPVQRWLRWAQVIGKPFPSAVHLRQEGRFRQGVSNDWMPFTAEEYFTVDPPGFLWSTEMRPFPLVSILGRDRYLDGEGSIEMRLLGFVPVAQGNGPAIDHGALLRYLNETMWFPAAALSRSITWEAIEANAARATIRDGGMTAVATFLFDDQGRPLDMTAERFDLARGKRETWSTPLRAYGEFDGVRVPVDGVGVWHYEDGDFPYIELRVTALEYRP